MKIFLVKFSFRPNLKNKKNITNSVIIAYGRLNLSVKEAVFLIYLFVEACCLNIRHLAVAEGILLLSGAALLLLQILDFIAMSTNNLAIIAAFPMTFFKLWVVLIILFD